MTKYEKALLDTIAYAEGTLGVSQNGYDIIYGTPPKKIVGWTSDTTIVHGGITWGAAGRYQFRYTTWNDINKKNIPITKTNQDNGALILINRKLKDFDKTKLINKSDFAIAIDLLKGTWVSFKVKPIDELFNIYLKAIALY